MKKILPLLIVGIFVITAFSAVAVPKANDSQLQSEIIAISAPQFNKINQYTLVTCDEATSLHLETGKPVVPVISKVYSFPLGTTLEGVSVEFSDYTSYPLNTKIVPAPQPVPLLDSAMVPELTEDATIYTSSQIYPNTEYKVETGAGLKDDQNVMYVVVRCYPYRYAPETNSVVAAEEINIDISYQLPTQPTYFEEEYDMVVITPQKFVTNLQPLVDHKTSNGMTVMVKTTEEIYDEYTAGRDEPEKIKLFIYDMKETYNIKYVLLGGGRKGQSHGWLVPERRTNNDDGWESGYASDLYYADIYKMDGNTTVFEDWDSNGNDKFAEFKGAVKDTMDFYPDVIVGRLTFRYGFEANKVVDKIITYETTANGASWFDDVVLIAGDTFPAGDNAYEGELETQVAADWLTPAGFNVEKLWTSQETLTGVQDVVDAIRPGVGFAYFAGHGNPATWSTHPPKDDSVWITGLSLQDFPKLRNGDKLPMMVVGGCHNAQFNTSLYEIIIGIQKYGFASYFGLGDQPSNRFFYNEWVPRDWSSAFLLCRNGGSIGSIGMSSLGYGYNGYFTTEGLGGWLDPRYFDAYVNSSKEYMGDAHSQAITDYINIIGNVNSDQIDRKTIEAWVLLGDPSVKLGGL